MKEVEEFLLRDLDDYCKANMVVEVKQGKTGVIIKTKKSNLVFEGLTMERYRSTHCSCVDITRSHWTQVKEILRRCIMYSDFVYEDK